MTSIFKKLTKQEEETALPWQTKRLKDFPQAIHRLAAVVAAIEQHYLSDEWEFWVTDTRGSITLRHKTRHQQLVRVFIDDGNRLASTNSYQMSDEPIVVGIDLTDYPVFERHAIREYLRLEFPYYVDPESIGQKIKVKPDYDHWLDVLFIPAGSCNLSTDHNRIQTIIEAVQQESISSQ